MIAAISLMRRQDAVPLSQFRRHWLTVHGPLVCAFPRLRRYVQCHVIASPANNQQALDMRIDGFPILFFDNDADRLTAQQSPEMAACNIDSQLFVGAVSRAAADADGHLRAGHGRFSLIEMWPETATLPDRPMLYRVREQGRAPASTIAHLPVTVGSMTQTWFDSILALEAHADEIRADPAARFAVEEHWLA